MDFNFTDKVVLITGASSGIGESTAKMFAEAGATVVLAARREELLQEHAEKLTDRGLKASYVVCDVTDEDQVIQMMNKIEQEHGKLDYAFNNAGIMPDETITADIPMSEFDHVLNVNLRSVFLSMKYELQLMSKQDDTVDRAIVNCSSIGGLIGMPGRSTYHASKHAVTGLTKSTALEYGPKNIRVNAVCPATIQTPMVQRMQDTGMITDVIEPIGRVGRPEEVAGAVLWLCSPYSTYVIGQSIAIDGGFTVE